MIPPRGLSRLLFFRNPETVSQKEDTPMNAMKKTLGLILVLCLLCGFAAGAAASTFTDAHGNVIELDDSLEAYTDYVLRGADNAARKEETNLGDL